MTAACVSVGLFAVAGCGEPAGPDTAASTETDRPVPPATPTVPSGPPWFVDVSDETGLAFRHDSGASGRLWLPEITGAGAAFVDFDGDGDLDVYLTNGNRELGGARDGSPPVNRLFRQRADGSFEDATEASGLGDPGYGMGVATGDYDNDGDVDVFVANVGRDRLFANRGDGTFDDVTASAGVAVDGWSSSATFCDYDGDGWLDLYVVRYVVHDPEKVCTDPAGRPDYCGPQAFPSEQDVLLHNRGDGRFEDATERSGILGTTGAGLGVVCDDFDDDGRPDFYVANDLDPNQLWVNRGDGRFTDEALVRGSALNLEGRTESGMGVVAADFDGDIDLDLFLTHLATQTNTLYRNFGGGNGFEDATGASGLAEDGLPLTGFGTAAFDVELDGDLDLVVANGRVLRAPPVPDAVPEDPWRAYAEPNRLYLNNGRGRFARATGGADALTPRAEVSRGLAAGDYDRDGDIDLLVANTHGVARLYRNDAPRAGSWLGVRVVDPKLRRDVIGARVVLITDDDRRQRRTIGGGYGYLAANEADAHFGIPAGATATAIEIVWPGGESERFEVPEVDTKILIERGSYTATVLGS